MNTTTVGIGAVAILYGIFTLCLRAVSPSSFKKLDAMKKMWGDSAGVGVHFVAYTIIPIVVGAVLVYMGVTGTSNFDR